MGKPIVAIVGRPNVGKSTLFNRLTGGRVAIVEDVPGVTRDRLYRDAEWAGRVFTVVDTGGIDFSEGEVTNSIVKQMRFQAEIAIGEADVVLFLVDAKTGLMPDDYAIAEVLRRSHKPVILVANKVEDFSDKGTFIDFYQLGVGEPIPISAAHGMNTGDLLDKLVEIIPSLSPDPYPDGAIKVAVIGRPNVGKSSLVNRLLGHERSIVSNVPGTTRDALDTPFYHNGRLFILVDTAGIRRKARIELPTERYSVIRSLKAIDRSDVALMLLDGQEGVTEQDKRIAGYAHEAGKAMIVVVNKWDLVVKDDKTLHRYEKEVKNQLSFMSYAPIVFISALTGQRVYHLPQLIWQVAEQSAMRIGTSELNDLLREAVALNPPPTYKGKKLKIYYATQASVQPPTFILFVNQAELVHFSYLRYLENQLRQTYGFTGTPIRLSVRQREGPEGASK